MKFYDLQENAVNLIRAAASFADAPEAKVLYDFGFSKSDFEKALDMEPESGASGPGYCVGVWPVTSATAQDEAAGLPGAYAQVLVRFEINPEKLKAVQAAHVGDDAQPTAGKFLNSLIKEIVDAVLTDPAELGGVQFQLDAEAFELVTFDDGLIAYHIRFKRFCTL